MSFHVPESSRVNTGALASEPSNGNNGAFIIRLPGHKYPMLAIASDGGGWEHVSLTLPPQFARCPSWEELQAVKNIFWDNNDCVVQFHPPETEHVNNHNYCLHLWRCPDQPFPLPPKEFV